MSQSSSKIPRIPTFWAVLAFSVVLFAFFYLFEPERSEIPQQQLPWNSQYDAENRLHALGLVVDQSSAQDAIALYEEEFEFRIFSEKDESNKIAEVQIPKIHIGTIRGALFLKLNATQERLTEMYSQGVETTVTKNGQREVTPFNDDIEQLKLLTFSEMTFIPRKNLNERALKMRFGEPDRIEDTKDSYIKRWVYSQKGLDILFNSEGPEAFVYKPK